MSAFLVGLLALSAPLLSSCTTLQSWMFPENGRSRRHSTSLVEYLYPNETDRIETPSIPQLVLPLRVGVAFVPGATYSTASLSEAQRIELMEKITKAFHHYSFVKSIAIIPSDYLAPRGSFTNLDQIRTMYGIDLVSLISFNQIQHTNEGLLAFSYWTIIGAYVFKGEKNDTSTMMDTAVFHIPSRKMLFRAPGTSRVRRRATPVNLSEELLEDSRLGFDEAAEKMVQNLQNQLALFKEKVKESPEEFVVVRSSGYTGAGNLGLFYLAILMVLRGSSRWPKRKQPF